MNFKGQYFSFDAIIASVIFVLALVALFSYWHSVKAYLDYQSDPLSREVVRVSNLLFTPPSPSSDCASMERLGFSKSWDDRRLDLAVIECAEAKASADPTWLNTEFGTPYKLSIEFTNLTGTPARLAYVGAEPPPDATDVVKMHRLATVVDGSTGATYLAAVDLKMYK